jgi:hypothetical protein
MCWLTVAAAVVALVGVEQPHQLVLVRLAVVVEALEQERNCGYLP